jgi:hypothetical protein
MSRQRIMPSVPDDDATVRISPPAPKRRGHWGATLAGLCTVAILGGGGAWLAFAPRAPHVSVPPAASIETAAPPSPAPPSGPPRIAVTSADEATILADRSPDLRVFAFAADPRVLVLSFATLHAQGLMLNRLGAFVEKAGVPRDRVLADPELEAAILRAGETADTYNYGHDYRAADLARFFDTAAREGVPLRPDEQRLGELLVQRAMLAPGAVGAVISIPPETTNPPVGAAARATILRHELSHAAYFTDPAYAAYARLFWETVLTEEQRAGFRRFLVGEGYDGKNEDLMLNEAQAYLIHTRDRRFFDPKLAGLSDAEADRLREIFLRDMPEGWLRDLTRAPRPLPPLTAAAPSVQPARDRP